MWWILLMFFVVIVYAYYDSKCSQCEGMNRYIREGFLKGFR